MAGRKRFEFRLSFGRLACEPVREGDTRLLNRVGGEVEAACDVGEVRIHTDLRPEEVADLARGYDLGAAKPYFDASVPKHPVTRAEIPCPFDRGWRPESATSSRLKFALSRSGISP